MDELEFIEWLKGFTCGCESISRLTEWGIKIVKGIGDDLAVIGLSQDRYLVFGSDMISSGVHFNKSDDPEKIGWKALAVALSDCAAMGAEPIGSIVSVSIPSDLSIDYIKFVYKGLRRCSDEFSCPILGGDSIKALGELTIDVAILGITCKPLFRNGARAGEWIYTTGKLGGSILSKHLEFMPRIREAIWLRDHIPIGAMMDISDGLLIDLFRMCDESRCGAVLEQILLEDIISDDARRLAERTFKEPLEHALSDGEDFELLLTSRLEPCQLIETLPDFLRLFPIGRVIEGDGIYLQRENKLIRLTVFGYKHF